MLRILLFIFLAFLILRLIRFFSIGKKIFKDINSNHPSTRQSSKGPVLDTMVACATCGTYNPKEISLKHKGLYFCDARCVEKHPS